MSRLIDPIELKIAISVSNTLHDGKTLEQIIDEQPTIEVPEIILCKECEHNNSCYIQYAAQAGDGFHCGYAERREGENE